MPQCIRAILAAQVGPQQYYAGGFNVLDLWGCVSLKNITNVIDLIDLNAR